MTDEKGPPTLCRRLFLAHESQEQSGASEYRMEEEEEGGKNAIKVDT